MEHKSGSLSPRLAEAFVMQAHFRVDAQLHAEKSRFRDLASILKTIPSFMGRYGTVGRNILYINVHTI